MRLRHCLPTIFLLTCLLAGATGCATSTPQLTILVPDSLRQPCASPSPDGVVTVSDLAAHSIRQESALVVCDKARGALVDLIDAQAAIVAPKRRWPMGLLGTKTER
jgi:hypothetical protein